MKAISILCILFFLTSCATVGQQFNFNGPKDIIIGQTNQQDLLNLYGKPFRVGYSNGEIQWTYGYYKYKVFGESETKDLLITFDKNGIVSSYVFNSSLEEDKMKVMAKQAQ